MQVHGGRARQVLATAALLLGLGSAHGAAAQATAAPAPATAEAQASADTAARIPAAIWTSASEIEPWKRITLGTYKDVNLLREDLDSTHCGRKAADPQVAGLGSIRVGTAKPRQPPCNLGDAASEVIGRPAFKLSRTRTELDLVVLTAADLGLDREDGVSLDDIYARAELLGFALCPAEVGPQLRLQYLDQRVGEFLHVAMRPLARYGGDPISFTVANGGAGLLLLGGDGHLDLVVPPTLRFVFARPQ